MILKEADFKSKWEVFCSSQSVQRIFIILVNANVKRHKTINKDIKANSEET